MQTTYKAQVMTENEEHTLEWLESLEFLDPWQDEEYKRLLALKTEEYIRLYSKDIT